MRKASSSIGMAPKNRVLDSLVSPLYWWKFHDGAGTNAKEAVNDVDYAIAGTTAGIWATAGAMTPVTDTYVPIAGATGQEILRLDTLTSGGLLIMGAVYFAAVGAANSVIISMSPFSGTQGGLSLVFNASEKFEVYITMAGGSNTRLCADVTIRSLPAEMTVVAYYDCRNLQGTLYVNGVLRDGPTSFPSGALPYMNTGLSATIGARSVVSPDESIAGQGAGNRIHNLMVLRSATDISTKLSDIATQYAAAPRELPLALEGL